MSARRKSTGREFYKYWGIGFEFAVAVGLGFYLGAKADQRWGLDPWGLLTGGGIGFASGLYLLVKSSSQMMRDFDGASGGDDDGSDRDDLGAGR